MQEWLTWTVPMFFMALAVLVMVLQCAYVTWKEYHHDTRTICDRNVAHSLSESGLCAGGIASKKERKMKEVINNMDAVVQAFEAAHGLARIVAWVDANEDKWNDLKKELEVIEEHIDHLKRIFYGEKK